MTLSSTAHSYRTDTTVNPIIGAGVLGSGFNIFGAYSDESALRPLLSLGDYGQQWTSPAGTTYDVPGNTNLDPSSSASGSATTYSSKESFTSHFAATAGVSGSYGAFKGEFEASFALDESKTSDYSFGLYDQRMDCWSLSLINWSATSLLPSVSSDPDYTSLPEVFNEDNQYLFFRFFAKFGTHFVSEVQCGARMSYTVAVLKSFMSSSLEISTKLSAEFKGVFADAKANASADFEVANQSWFESRQVTVRTIGGDSSLVATVSPSYNVNNNEPFTDWIKSAEKHPAPTDFQLTPVSSLFAGDQAAAVSAAYEAYANSRLYAESRFDGALILLSGEMLEPEPETEGPAIIAAVIDRTTLKPSLVRSFAPSNDSLEGYNAAWTQASADLSAYASPDSQRQYILALTLRNWWNAAYPTIDMVGLLQSCGAGSGLDLWIDSWSQSASPIWIYYSLLGVMGLGPGAGIEVFSHTSRSDEGKAIASGLLLATGSGSESGETFEFSLLPA